MGYAFVSEKVHQVCQVMQVIFAGMCSKVAGWHSISGKQLYCLF